MEYFLAYTGIGLMFGLSLTGLGLYRYFSNKR